MPEAINLLTSRRSVKPIELSGPGPTATELATAEPPANAAAIGSRE